LIELIVLLMCRDATTKYAWSAHVNLAREAGLIAETIEAIRARASGPNSAATTRG